VPGAFLGEPMDKREALEKCRDHWKYIAATGTDDKEEYFDKFNIPAPLVDCYCCEYDQFVLDKLSSWDYYTCDLCPLVGYAWGKGYESCLRFGSPYKEWVLLHSEDGGTEEDRRYYARMIVRACNLALADMEDEYGQVY
jgi:hypothetical protein